MLSVSGCRGIVGESLTPEAVARFIDAAVQWACETRHAPSPLIVLGFDGRRGGEALKRVAADALVAAGCRVIDIGVAATPTIGVMVTHRGADAGITLTASHNPAEWNGVKVITAEGAAPDAEAAQRIIQNFHQGEGGADARGSRGTIEDDRSAAQVHVDRVIGALASVADLARLRERRFTVAVDSVNASGAEGAGLLLESLGCRLIHVNAEGTGEFPHPPEPTRENLSAFAACVGSCGAEVGFAQDPDADRLALIDESGRYIGEEYTLGLSAAALLGAPGFAARGASLVANLSTSRMLDDVASRFGATVHRSAVGEANVVAAMRRAHAVMGGEGNGGVIWPAVTMIRDSLGAMALTLALLARKQRPLSRIVEEIPAYAIEKRKIELRPGLAARALAETERAFAGPGVRVDRQDGVRLDFPAPGGRGSAWLHVRPSNTEPILRLIAEAPSADEARRILDRAQAGIGGG
jgi:phosphomannomutase